MHPLFFEEKNQDSIFYHVIFQIKYDNKMIRSAHHLK